MSEVGAQELMHVRVKVNGQWYEADVEPRMLLIDMLRDILGFTGPHIGCDTGHCGACTVIMNGRSVKSCMVLAVQADGSEIMTVEGLEKDGKLHPLQEAFWENHALQCGYCTPGQLMSAYFLLSRNPNPSEEEIRKGIEGNLCRCTGYVNIVKAIKAAAQKMADAKMS